VRQDSRCSHCDGFVQAALEASKAYHDLLGALEAADIRHDTELAYHLQVQQAKSVLNRDNSVMALRDHERTHAKSAPSG
jgi:HD superfamily phosphohydrolase YqeK